MTTCRYCGQVLPPGEESVASSRRDRRPSSGGASPSGEPRVLDDGDPEPRTTIAVDEALLTLCNRAHAQADQNGCQMVEIAHLVMIMTSAHLADREFECEGLSRRDVAMAAERTLASAARGTPPSKPRTSPELRVLLVRAERLARADAREFTSAQDFLRALAQQSGDLVSARFVPDALLYHRRAEHSAALPERHPVRREWREPRQQRFDFQTGGAEPTNRSAELPTVRDVLGEPDAGSLGMRTLIERVERQGISCPG